MTLPKGEKAIAKRVVDILIEEQQHKINMVEKISGQTIGKQFEMLTMEFLQATFPNLHDLKGERNGSSGGRTRGRTDSSHKKDKAALKM